MKIVLWRIAHDCLPTEHQLRFRNIPVYDLCCHCGRNESIEHAFLTCQYVAEIWRELKKKRGFRQMSTPFMSPWQWIFEILVACSEREAIILVISLWHIWEARMQFRMEGRKCTPPYS
jgi:hypothetical protein